MPEMHEAAAVSLANTATGQLLKAMMQLLVLIRLQ
jgi:hypothetical protein